MMYNHPPAAGYGPFLTPNGSITQPPVGNQLPAQAPLPGFSGRGQPASTHPNQKDAPLRSSHRPSGPRGGGFQHGRPPRTTWASFDRINRRTGDDTYTEHDNVAGIDTRIRSDQSGSQNVEMRYTGGGRGSGNQGGHRGGASGRQSGNRGGVWAGWSWVSKKMRHESGLVPKKPGWRLCQHLPQGHRRDRFNRYPPSL